MLEFYHVVVECVFAGGLDGDFSAFALPTGGFRLTLNIYTEK